MIYCHNLHKGEERMKTEKIEGEVYSFRKNANEEVKCIISTQYNQKLVKLRVFYKDGNDELRRSKRGIVMNINTFQQALPHIQQALNNTLPTP